MQLAVFRVIFVVIVGAAQRHGMEWPLIAEV